MTELFEHLDLQWERDSLERQLTAGAAIACHADADGFIAAWLASQLVSNLRPEFMAVSTDDLDLGPLKKWSVEHDIDSLALFDVNVWSSAGALQRLAGAIGQLTVYDDHIGKRTGSPSNVRIVELLPERSGSLPPIRPSSLFCYELLGLRNERSELAHVMAVAAAYGEGVIRPFRHVVPKVERSLDQMARAIGRGINAYYTNEEMVRGNRELFDLLIALADETEHGAKVTEALKGSEFFRVVTAVDELVSALVQEQARVIMNIEPWFLANGYSVYLGHVDAPWRILHLVASSARSSLNECVVITTQRTSNGIGVELRRSRSLTSPDLAAALLNMPSDLFVSRGGHPMASGATVVPGRLDDFLAVTRSELQQM